MPSPSCARRLSVITRFGVAPFICTLGMMYVARGSALAGGRGRVTGSIIGAFVIVFLADGMVMMGVSDFWQMVINGVVIVTAVVVDPFPQKLESKVILLRRHEEKLAAIPPNGATSS